jgi:hypothetical protein
MRVVENGLHTSKTPPDLVLCHLGQDILDRRPPSLTTVRLRTCLRAIVALVGVFSSLFKRLVDAFRPTADIARVMGPIEGSAAWPSPPALLVPEDLKRAVDEENRRKAARGQDTDEERLD